MIIGISGKIGSGKDTIAEIIQYLLFCNNKHEVGLDNSFEEFRKIINKEWSKEEITIETSFEIRRFADKLKDIVCLFIDCTREQLEDREFKEKELGEEWTRYAYAIGHKDIYLNGEFTKEMISRFCSKEKYEEERITNWQTAYKSPLTPRLLLQLLGTNCGRDIIHPNIWINALMLNYRGESLGIDKYGVQTIKYPNWIITDVRFENEVKAIKDKGGIVIRVNRIYQYGKQALDNIKQIANQVFENEHPSETALDDYKDFDYIIDNDSDIQSLIEKIKIILKNENIL